MPSSAVFWSAQVIVKRTYYELNERTHGCLSVRLSVWFKFWTVGRIWIERRMDDTPSEVTLTHTFQIPHNRYYRHGESMTLGGGSDTSATW
jgi:hypothetical protein